MTITIETQSIDEITVLLDLLKQFNIKNVKVKSDRKKIIPIVKGDKSIAPDELFGIWANRPKTKEEIRSTTWKRDWNI